LVAITDSPLSKGEGTTKENQGDVNPDSKIQRLKIIRLGLDQQIGAFLLSPDKEKGNVV